MLASLLNLDTAFRNFFQKRTKFPSSKKKYVGEQSFQCPQHVKVDLDNSYIDFPKIKNVKIKLHRKLIGKIKTCTIKKTPTNKYFVSILVKNDAIEPIAVSIREKETIGLDLGVKYLIIASNGDKYKNNKFSYKNTKRLKKLQRRLSKKQDKSSNRAKARVKLAKLHEKIAKQKLDEIHQASAKLVYKSQDTTFALEDLNISGMLKNHKLARAISDCSWNIFQRALEYKCKWAGENIIKIDRFSPSSKKCSKCGNIKDDLQLSMRVYDCVACDTSIDRYINAAINIRNFALAELGMDGPEVKSVDHALPGVASAV